MVHVGNLSQRQCEHLHHLVFLGNLFCSCSCFFITVYVPCAELLVYVWSVTFFIQMSVCYSVTISLCINHHIHNHHRHYHHICTSVVYTEILISITLQNLSLTNSLCIWSFIHFHSFIHLSINLFFDWLIYLLISIHSFVRSFIHPSIIHSFIRSRFIHSFIY